MLRCKLQRLDGTLSGLLVKRCSVLWYALLHSAIVHPDGRVCDALEKVYTGDKFHACSDIASGTPTILAILAAEYSHPLVCPPFERQVATNPGKWITLLMRFCAPLESLGMSTSNSAHTCSVFWGSSSLPRHSPTEN
eukprot:4972883-Amphidinium_carterae.1